MITYEDVINHLNISINNLDALDDKDPCVFMEKNTLIRVKIYLLQLNRMIAQEEYYAEWIPKQTNGKTKMVCSLCGAPESGEYNGHCIICDAIMRKNKNENS